MNERIAQLMAYASGGACYDGNQLALYGEDIEKFAELIVRECMEHVWYTREEMIDETISRNIRARMAKHFGVEE